MNPNTKDKFPDVLRAIGDECRLTEVAHGFGTQSPGEDIALMHSELSEALEEIRKPNGVGWETYYNPEKPTKPEGVPAELADVLIRMLGFCARNNIDLGKAVLEKMAYNESRPYRHGGKTL